MPELFRRLAADLERSREALVPPAFGCLWEVVRFLVLYGGRSAAKSWSIARVLLVLAHDAPLRILCCREIQGSIRESAYRLLADQIQMLQLDDFFEIQSDNIQGRNGSRFYFEGLKYNASKIRSYEGVEIVWVEEAQNVSELSWETLLPTIRKAGSRFFISFNPMTRDDPVGRRFVHTPPPGTIVKKVSYRDNPFLSAEAEAERAWLERTDPDAYRHVWEGEPRTVSDALILKNKYAIEEFTVRAHWAGPYHGLDYGFARDPSAAVRCFIDDDTRTLYVTHEFWQLGADIDALPGVLEAAIPGISRHVLYCDSARPESTSYIARNGIPNARSAEKWPGSVDDGIAYLRSFSRIVIDPRCKHFIDEAGSYSFKTDRLTGAPLPEPEDRNNHLIDALRYALSPLIRNLPTGGFFSRAAFLATGEPLEPSKEERAMQVITTIAICDRPGTAVGVIHWGVNPYFGCALCLLDYDIAEFDQAFASSWLAGVYARAQELRTEWLAPEMETCVWIEEGELHDALLERFYSSMPQSGLPGAPSCDIRAAERENLPPTLDERASRIRANVNGGLVRFSRHAYVHQICHRSVTANHLLGQLLGYRPGAKDAAAELLSAFTLGVLLALESGFR
jgi:phage terminase large subunit